MPVPTWVRRLRTRRDEITTELESIDNNTARNKPGAKPDVSGDGGGVQGTEYRMSLYRELAAINKALKEAEEVIAAEESLEEPGPFEFESQVDS